MNLGKLLQWLKPSGAASGNNKLRQIDPAAADAAVLQAMTQHGADLAKPRETRFYVYMVSQEAAQAAAEHLKTQGFAVEPVAQYGNERAKWLVLATTTLVVNHASIAELRAQMTALAETGDGVFDGWEAAL